LIVTGGALMPRTHEPSHGAGHTRPVELGEIVRLVEAMEEKKLRTQGARCMDCGVPFCHTGKTHQRHGERLSDQQPDPGSGMISLPRPGKDALDRLHKTNNFPEFTGPRVSGAVRRLVRLGINAPPVTIKNIENSIVDKGWERVDPPRGAESAHRKKSRGHRSGPAGLSPPRSSTAPVTP